MLVNHFKKISIFTWIACGLMILSVILVYYADYENKKWGTDIGTIQNKYLPERTSLHKAIPRGEATISGEIVHFFTITQGEVDSIKTSYNSGFFVGLGQYFPPIDNKSPHINSYNNDAIGVGPRVCYSLVYSNYPDISGYNYTTKKPLQTLRDSINEINQSCKAQGIYENTLRPEIIKNLQDLREIFEKNGIEVMSYMNSLPPWKERVLYILNYHFFQKSEISKIIIDGVFLMIITETITRIFVFLRRKKL